jgi:hypothetical protein
MRKYIAVTNESNASWYFNIRQAIVFHDTNYSLRTAAALVPVLVESCVYSSETVSEKVCLSKLAASDLRSV